MKKQQPGEPEDPPDSLDPEWEAIRQKIEKEVDGQPDAVLVARYMGEASGFLQQTMLLSKGTHRELAALTKEVRILRSTCTEHWRYIPKGSRLMWYLETGSIIFEKHTVGAALLLLAMVLMVALALFSITALGLMGWDVGRWLDSLLSHLL